MAAPQDTSNPDAHLILATHHHHPHEEGARGREVTGRGEAIPREGGGGGGAGGCWGARHTVALLAMLGIFLDFMIQTILAVPMVAMVGRSEEGVEAIGDVCPVPGDHNITNDTKPGEFDWDEKTQGIIQGCIYYGFIFISVPGGRLAEVYGGKRMFGLMLGCGSLLVLVSPVAAYSSTWLFIAVRVMQGIAIGGMFPAMNIVVVKWFPPAARPKFISITMTGQYLGCVTCMALSGWLCDVWGWPAPFYVVGAAGVVWTALWFLLVHPTPEEHPRISQDELHYILGSEERVLKKEERSVQSEHLPWALLLRTPALWVVTMAAMGDSFTTFTLLTMLPTYLTNIQHYSLQNAGVVAALPQLLSGVVVVCWGYVVGRLAEVLTTRHIRQLSSGLAFYVPALCMLGMSVVGCNTDAAVALLCLCVCVNTLKFAGFYSSFQDMSPTYCGTALGFAGIFSSLTCVAGPLVTGLLINERQTLEAWRNVFFISAAIYIVCCSIYIIFTPSRQHHWDNPSVLASSSSSSSFSSSSSSCWCCPRPRPLPPAGAFGAILGDSRRPCCNECKFDKV